MKEEVTKEETSVSESVKEKRGVEMEELADEGTEEEVSHKMVKATEEVDSLRTTCKGHGK